MTALDNAIQAAGSARKLGLAIGVSGMAISQWRKKIPWGCSSNARFTNLPGNRRNPSRTAP